MKIEILNCNNIEQGTFEIRENVLNIKYAINGAGKSTLAKAIAFSVMNRLGNKKQLSELTPFKYQGNAERAPQVKGIEGISSIRIFDEDYVNDFVFQPDELLKGSFDIFIRGEDYEKGIQIIDKLVNEIKKLLAEDKDIEGLIRDLTELSNGFGKPTQKGIHGSSPLSKALKGGNKVANIPVGLEDYKDFIQGAENFKWIKWQMDGKAFIDISERCPYCVGDISEKKGRIRRISEEYDAKSVENLNKMVEVFQRLNQYFSESTRKKIDEFVENTSGYTDDQVNFLREVRDQIDRLRGKFSKAQSIGFHSLKDVDKVVEELKSYCIDLGLFNHLQSENTESKAKVVNDSIDRIQEKAGELQGNINKQKILIEKLVKENSTEINGFLRNAGYSYSVDIKPDGNGEYRLKLTHNDIDGEVSNVRTHLSYGERNAFALVLFMYDVLKKNPDLIVLDDPISSFDKNKKYAIVDILFRKGGSLRGKTVLLLTHDFEPVVDMVKHHSDRFEGLSTSFLENTHGSLAEKGIVKADICSFIDISNENIRDAATPLLSKLVYLRRLFEVTNEKVFEVTNEKGLDYHIISNLFHKREKPEIPGENGKREMTQYEINEGNSKIKEKIADFDYAKMLATVKDDAKLIELYEDAENNYEKLHIFRIFCEGKPEPVESDVIRKFINETFHIENDYIYQINPRKYQLVPQYVIDECDRIIASRFR